LDMFEGIDEVTAPSAPADQSAQPKPPTALGAGILKKAETPPVQRETVVTMPASEEVGGEPLEIYPAKKPVLGKIIVVLVILVVAGGLGWVGWRLYSAYTANQPAGQTQTPAVVSPNEAAPTAPAALPETPPITETTPTPAEEAATGTAAADMTSDQVLFGEQVDTDRDGLSDVREQELGTDLNLADTDHDGLTDGDEVLIWKTNPLNPDSDGDSYLDGEEVRNGYNPLGPGKLFNTPTTTATSS